MKSRIQKCATLASVATVAAMSTLASAAVVTPVSVVGTDAIWLAGRTDVTIAPPGPAPMGYPLTRTVPTPGPYSETEPLQFSAAAGEAFSFSATGVVNLDNRNIVKSTPDGAGFTTQVLPVGGIGGYNGPEGALVGVFETNTNPALLTPPPTLNFLSGTSFTTLSPAIDQVFFVGDGRTGNASGGTQVFTAPTGATQLFLGVVDVNSTNLAGYYDDNSGSFGVTVTANVPEPASISLALMGGSVLALRRRARR